MRRAPNPFNDARLERLTESLPLFLKNDPNDVGIKVTNLLGMEGTESLLAPNQLPIHRLRADPEVAELLALKQPASWGKKDPTSLDVVRVKTLVAAGVAWYRRDGSLQITVSQGGFDECGGCGERHSTAVVKPTFHQNGSYVCYHDIHVRSRDELGLKVHECMISDFNEPIDFRHLRKGKYVRLSRLDGHIHVMEGRHVKRCTYCGVLVGGNVSYSEHSHETRGVNCFPADRRTSNGRVPHGYGGADSPVREQIIEPSLHKRFPNS